MSERQLTGKWLKIFVLNRAPTQQHSKAYVSDFCLGTISSARFQPTTVIPEQPQNSGTLRNFRNKDIQILVGRLSAAITTPDNVHEYETQFEQMHLTRYVMKYNDVNHQLLNIPKKGIPFKMISLSGEYWMYLRVQSTYFYKILLN